MLSTRLPDKAYPIPYLLIMAHTLIYIVCILQRSSLSLVESKLPHLVDKDVSPSAQTELLRSRSWGFGSVEKEQGKGRGKGRGKGKFGIGRMQGLQRNVQNCQYQGTVATCHVSPWHCSFLNSREHLLKLAFAVLSTKLSLSFLPIPV